MMARRRREIAGGDALVVKEVGEEADQLGERERDERAGYTDEHRHEANDEHAGVGGEIPPVGIGNGRHDARNLVEASRFWVFLAPAIRLFGTVDLVGGGFQPLLYRRLGLRHANRNLLFLTLAAHAPKPCVICRACWRSWFKWK